MRRVIEISCGTAPYVEQWHRRGYRYCGLDLSPVPTKIFFPQEFLCLVELNRRFDFVGWFNDFDFAPPLTSEGRHIAILRKR
jgi:hypothetical protein